MQNTRPLSQSPLWKNKSSVQGNREPVNYLENERKREKKDDEKTKGVLSVNGGMSSLACLEEVA